MANRKPPALFAALCMLAALAACAPRADEPPPAVTGATLGDMAGPDIPIRDLARGHDLAFGALIDQLARADALLLGEQHDNPDHHRLQAVIARELVARGRRIVVAFEMIDESQQPALDGFLAGRPRDAAALGPLLAWDASGWPAWAQYRPIAEAALTQARSPARPLRAANLPLAVARDIARNGLAARSLDAARAATLGQAAAGDAAALAVHAEAIRESHCGMLPESALAPFALAQYARDAAMADSLLAARADDPDALVLLIAGNGHARNDVGVPRHLARRAPGLTLLSLGAIEGQALPQAAPFDAVWLSAPRAREDPCEAFRRPPP